MCSLEWSKLKNLILLILLVVNIFLLVLVLGRQTQSQRYENQAREEVIAILGKNGISLDHNLLPDETSLSVRAIPRNEAVESAQAAVLLGDEVYVDPDGAYTSSVGRLRFYPDGAFSFTATQEAFPMGENSPLALTLAVLNQLGIDCQLSAISADETTVTLTLYYQGTPVFTPREVTASFQDRALVSVEGYHISETLATEEDGEPLSVATLLLNFLDHIKDNGIIFLEITAITNGYQLLAMQGGQPRLIPAWHIVTDTGNYYLNALTGALF